MDMLFAADVAVRGSVSQGMDALLLRRGVQLLVPTEVLGYAGVA